MAALFATTLFLSAALLFWIQPMLAKMVLPLLGGTPAVWNTCMLFFQAMLLAGYAYAHWLSRTRQIRTQMAIQLGLLLLASLVLPIHLPERALHSIPSDSNPSGWLLGCLLLSAGLPFFAVSANGPLLQRWFSRSRHPAAADPYFLYAASNLGSLLALLGYPLVLEPWLHLTEQTHWWSVGFSLLAALILGCGSILLWNGRSIGGRAWESQLPISEADIAPPVMARQRWRWCLLAFVPSSLMLGVTTYLTTDIASIPLLWVLPLSIYLLSFILVFARSGQRHWVWTLRALPMGVIALCYLLLSEATEPVWLLLGLHLCVFFLVAMVCHGQLATERPGSNHLTEFYLWISVGGVLGGLLNALAAPVLFTAIVEYPLAIVLACLLRPGQARTLSATRWLRVAVPLSIGLLTLMLSSWLPGHFSLPLQLRLGLSFGIPLLLCYAAVEEPMRFAFCIAAVLLVSSLVPGTHGRPVRADRNFFGVLRVTRDPIGPFYRLVHGNTVHGRQAIDPERRNEPLSYYHRTGPLGQIFGVYCSHSASPNVGVVGLGAGSMACYAQPGQAWTFYEINPAVINIATNTNYFTFMALCAASEVQLVTGDARLRLREAQPHHYGLLLLDAFSSDAIPLHLMTREALALYLSKLAPGGLLAFHISNRCLDLADVLGDLAKDAHLVCRAHDEIDPGPRELADGIDQSHWLVMARRNEDLGKLPRDARWLEILGRPKPEVWTDDFSNLISVFKGW